MAQKTTTPTPAAFTYDKEMFKRSVLYNVKTLYRKRLRRSRFFRQSAMPLRMP